MGRHPDFQKILDNFILTYGEQKGKRLYDSYIHNESFNEGEPMTSQNMDGCHCSNCDTETPPRISKGFTVQDVMSYPSILQIIGTDKDEQLKINFKNDAIQNNFEQVKSSIEKTIELEKKSFIPIVNSNIEKIYEDGISEAAQELSMSVEEFGNIRGKKRQIKILQENSQQLAFTLLDEITKDITLRLTDINLNNIPFTNTELKKEVQDLFKKKFARLQSQIVTETDRSFNTALEFGYKESGIVTHKQWVAIMDDKTSDICRTGNGEIVEIGQPFSTGDFTAPFHINCRSRIKAITISSQEN